VLQFARVVEREARDGNQFAIAAAHREWLQLMEVIGHVGRQSEIDALRTTVLIELMHTSGAVEILRKKAAENPEAYGVLLANIPGEESND
jgi:hypothetical protein